MQSLMSVLNVTGVSWVCSALSVYDEVSSRWFTLGPQLNPRLSLRVELVTHGTSSVVTSCLRQSTRSWTLKSQQLSKAADLLFLSFTQWCKSLKSLDFVAVPQSLSVRSMVSQWHLEQDENLVLLCAAVWGNSGTPREWGSKSFSWDKGVLQAYPGSLQCSKECVGLLGHLKRVISLFISWFCCFHPFCYVLHGGSSYLPALEIRVVWDVKV